MLRSVIANRDNVTFLKALTIVGCLHKIGECCCDKFRLKAYFRTGTKKISEQRCVTKPVTSSSVTDLVLDV